MQAGRIEYRRISLVPALAITIRPSGSINAPSTRCSRYASSPVTAPIETEGSGPIRQGNRESSAGRAFSTIRTPALSRTWEAGRFGAALSPQPAAARTTGNATSNTRPASREAAGNPECSDVVTMSSLSHFLSV